MEPLYYEEKLETPGIIFDKERSLFKIWGKSFPEEAKKFYEPLLNWIKEYSQDPNDSTVVHFHFDYYNSATATQILELLYLLDDLYKNGSKVSITWEYQDDDDDMKESGLEYSEILSTPFHFKESKNRE